MDHHFDVLSQASRNSVIVRQNILEKVGHRKMTNQIDIEEKAAASKLNDEMRLMRKSLVPNIANEGKHKKRSSLHRGSTESRVKSVVGRQMSSSVAEELREKQKRRSTEARSKSDGVIVKSNPQRNSVPAFPVIDSHPRSDGFIPPMTFYGLKQQKKEVERGGGGGGGGNNGFPAEDKKTTLMDKNLEERLQMFMGRPSASSRGLPSPRSYSVDATLPTGQKILPPWERFLTGSRGSGGDVGGGGSGGLGGRGSKADVGLTRKDQIWLETIAQKESSFVDENEEENDNSDLSDIKEDKEEGFPLRSLPPTHLPPIYQTQNRIIGNQKQNEHPVKQNLLLTTKSPPPDLDSMKNTRYLRPKAKRIQEWYDSRAKKDVPK